MIDPRRLGKGNSGLNEDDLSDIFCILHPSSLPAYRAASLIYEATPQHTIALDSEVRIRERHQDPQDNINSFQLAEQGLTSCAIALRLSGDVMQLDSGYRFGRNKQVCDCVMGYGDDVRMISNTHFSIYINEHGVIMLEDQSTNGTAVDGTMLMGKNKENGMVHRHTLEQGSVIVLTVPEPGVDYRFMVRIPQRDEESEAIYQQNLGEYLQRVKNAKLERQAKVAGLEGAGPREPVFSLYSVVAAPLTSLSSIYFHRRSQLPIRPSKLLTAEVPRSGEVVLNTTELASSGRAHLLLSGSTPTSSAVLRTL